MDSNLTGLPVQVRFPKGCRVKLSQEGREWLGQDPCEGRVVGYSTKDRNGITVVIDGQTSRSRYRSSYWERI